MENIESLEKLENTAERKTKIRLKDVMRLICSIGVYVFLFFLMGIYSFYAPEGYIQIATNKYLFYKKICLITAVTAVPFIFLYYILPPHKKNWEKIMRSISATDLFMLAFLCINIISFIGTQYRDEALWGTDGWYMGFAMQLFFIGTYFFVSRFYNPKIDVLPFLIAVSFLVFLWGLLNRFSIYPIDMQYDNEQFISSMGNINWFCGFWSIFFAAGVVLYVVTEKRWMRILSGIYSITALGLGAVEGSDSAFLAMGVVFFFLFLISFRKTVYMKRLLELGIFYCAACQVMRVIVKLNRESLSMDTTMMWIMLGNLTLVVLIILCILWVMLGKKDKQYKEHARIAQEAERWERSLDKDIEELKRSTGKEMPEGEWIWELIWLKYTVIGLTAAAFVIYLVLLVINTRMPGVLGPLSKYKMLLFNGSWGSARGATWRDGFAIFQSFSWRERLFGAGQDCFAIYGYSVPELAARLKEEWPNSRLTNAHNECITHLVNIGIFGLISFVGIFWSSFKRLLKKAEREPLCYVFAASILSYFIHNQFSFAQVLNTPYIYMMLGLGESLVRKGKTD